MCSYPSQGFCTEMIKSQVNAPVILFLDPISNDKTMPLRFGCGEKACAKSFQPIPILNHGIRVFEEW